MDFSFANRPHAGGRMARAGETGEEEDDGHDERPTVKGQFEIDRDQP